MEKARAMGADDRQRQHYWDVARALLMLLGIPYHAAMPYRAGQEWIVTAPQGSVLLGWLSEAIHIFRMPAFFVVAGYFVALMLARRSPGAWFGSRLVRLGVPFLTSLVVLVPLLNLACELSNFALPQAIRSLRHQMSISGGYWIRHLWFIVVLLYFSSLAALVTARWPKLRTAMLPARIDAAAARAFVALAIAAALGAGLYEAIAVELFYKAGLATMVPQQILRLDEAIIYAPWFAIGLVLHRAPRLLDAFTTPAWPILALAIAAAVARLALVGADAPMATRFVAAVAALGLAQVLLAALRTHLDRPSAIVAWIVRASFVVYLVHMPIAIALFDVAVALRLPVGTAFSAIVLLTAALSFAAFAIVDRSALLRLLFDGRPPPARPAEPCDCDERR